MSISVQHLNIRLTSSTHANSFTHIYTSTTEYIYFFYIHIYHLHLYVFEWECMYASMRMYFYVKEYMHVRVRMYLCQWWRMKYVLYSPYITEQAAGIKPSPFFTELFQSEKHYGSFVQLCNRNYYCQDDLAQFRCQSVMALSFFFFYK